MSKPILSRWPRLTRLPLALEIALALLFKIAILFALWYAFFSNPQAKHMLLPTDQVEQHLLTSASSDPDASPSTTDAATPSPLQPKAQQHGSD